MSDNSGGGGDTLENVQEDNYEARQTLDMESMDSNDVVNDEIWNTVLGPERRSSKVDTSHIKGQPSRKRTRDDQATEQQAKRTQTQQPGQVLSTTDRYPATDPGPDFVVLLERQDSPKMPHPIHVASALQKHNIAYVKFQPTGTQRIRMLFETAAQANAFLDASFTREVGWKPSIPQSRLYRIRNLPSDLNAQEILEELTASDSTPIVAADHLKRKDPISKEWVPSAAWKITFAGQSLPARVLLYGCPIRVQPYVSSVRQCTNCLGFEHVADRCPKAKKCPKCSRKEHDGDCTQFCQYCKSPDHPSSDPKCPRWETERKIKKQMAIHHLSYAAATKKVAPVPATPSRARDFPPIARRLQRFPLSPQPLQRLPLQLPLRLEHLPLFAFPCPYERLEQLRNRMTHKQ